ncbi:hypothetical protein AB0B28_09170 [Glycomyces sp. NPDC046736]|uniref:hypothetical protein n=1 Tax=Glycomyces sp. NPDC046736 TaxID=3155615 RepID=UPI0034085E74
MNPAFARTLAAAGAAALLLSGCAVFERASAEPEEEVDPVYAEMAAWDACEVLDNLAPITEYMGIEGYGSSTSGGRDWPSTMKIGNTWDPGAIGCNDLIYLGSIEGLGMSGEIKVKIVPSENENLSKTQYFERVASAEMSSAKWDDVKTETFNGPWDEGTMISWVGAAENPEVEVIAREGQWLFHIQLYHNYDRGERIGREPSFPFTIEERNRWFVDTYLPEVNQTINDKLAEVQ